MVRARQDVQRDALAILLIVGVAYLVLVVAIGWRLPADEARGYLYGVAQRAIMPSFSGVMLCGLIVVPLHAAWTLRNGASVTVAAAYEEFASWGQTLFTSTGFLGTIVGVSLAVAGLEAAMLAEDPGELVRGLSIAFDTTFLGLTSALLLMIFCRTLRHISKPGVQENEQ